MIKATILSLCISGVLICCTKPAMQVAAQIPVMPRNDTVVVVPTDTTQTPTKYFLALGDSYTIGQSVADTLRFPVQTIKKLTQSNVRFFPAEIIATTGWTTGNLLNRINTNPPLKSTYDIVTLLIGVNNQYQGLSQTQYQTEFTTLLNKAIVLAGNKKTHVIVLSIPDYSVTPFAAGYDRARIAAEIDDFNNINYLAATSLGVKYINITGYTRQAATDPSLIAYDGLHPSGKAYKEWADTLAPMIRAALQ
jgi:lysophospholipase L1-like esterase